MSVVYTKPTRPYVTIMFQVCGNSRISIRYPYFRDIRHHRQVMVYQNVFINGQVNFETVYKLTVYPIHWARSRRLQTGSNNFRFSGV